MTEHLRLNGVYWGLVALCLLNRPEALNREDMIKYVLSCWDEEAGKSDSFCPDMSGSSLGVRGVWCTSSTRWSYSGDTVGNSDSGYTRCVKSA